MRIYLSDKISFNSDLGKSFKRYLPLVFLVLLLIPSIWFLFTNGFIKTDDGDWMVVRFSAFYQALRDGQFPVRFLGRLNFGYGYPVANFLYPGFMYAAVPLHIFGLNFLNSIKAILGLSMVSSGVFMFFWLRKFFDEQSAFFGSLFYVYSPYHLFDLTKRGSAGELFSLAVFPFVLWQLERENFLWSAIGIAVLIIAHNSLAVLFLSVILLYMGLSVYVSKNRRKLFPEYAASLIFGLAMSAFFWMPAIFELSNTVFSETKISNYNQYFAEINQIGLVTILVFLSATALFVMKKNLIKKHRLTIVLLVVGIVSIFFATAISSVFWQVLPASFVQFPFRFLSVSIVCGAYLLAFVLSQFPDKYKIYAGVILIGATVFLSRDYLFPKQFYVQNDSFYATNEATTTVSDEYMSIWVKQKPLAHFKNKVEIVAGAGKISNVSYNSGNTTFDYSSDSPSIVRVATIYYPGWRAFSNGSEKAIFYDNKSGLMDLKLTSGVQTVKLSFGETPFRIISDLISVAGLFGFFIWNYRSLLIKKLKL